MWKSKPRESFSLERVGAPSQQDGGPDRTKLDGGSPPTMLTVSIPVCHEVSSFPSPGPSATTSCPATELKQWSQQTLDWDLWNHEPGHLPPQVHFWSYFAAVTESQHSHFRAWGPTVALPSGHRQVPSITKMQEIKTCEAKYQRHSRDKSVLQNIDQRKILSQTNLERKK